jgi:DNA-binding MarR family transcriptional regulator
VSERAETMDALSLALRELWLGSDQLRRSMAKSLSVGVSELAVLGNLHKDGRLTPREIGDRLGITTGSTTAVLDRIEREGFVVRAPNPDDRRSVHVVLTAKGESAMAQVVDALDKQLIEVQPKLSADEVEQLASGLSVLARALNSGSANQR